MVENTIKSTKRVKEHGEVFTPKNTVQLMLNQPGIKEASYSLTDTFFEPSAGEGAFLTAILERKMIAAEAISENQKDFDINALIALTTLYGVELLEDNVEQLVMNMIVTFIDRYSAISSEKFEGLISDDVVESAKTIIKANMVQGNAITKLNDRGEQLIFSEWTQVGRTQIKRVEYTLEAILNGGGPLDSVIPEKTPVEFDLFTGWFEDENSEEVDSVNEPELLRYKTVKVTKLFEERLEGFEDMSGDSNDESC